MTVGRVKSDHMVTYRSLELLKAATFLQVFSQIDYKSDVLAGLLFFCDPYKGLSLEP